MGTRRSNDDYPEHLNPFKKTGGIRGSFRELKRNLSIKFRRKEPTISTNDSRLYTTVSRNTTTEYNDPNVTLRPHVGTVQHHKSEMYPRSRFHERANKAQTMAPTTDNPLAENNAQSEENNNEDKSNPFNESSETAQPTQVDNPKPIKKKRRKKRAPLPPGRLGMNASDLNQSQWSISSYETDCSSAAYYSETTQDEHELDINGSYRGLNDINELSNEIISYCNNLQEDIDNNENVIGDIKSVEIKNTTADVKEIKNDGDKEMSNSDESALERKCDNPDNVSPANKSDNLQEENVGVELKPKDIEEKCLESADNKCEVNAQEAMVETNEQSNLDVDSKQTENNSNVLTSIETEKTELAVEENKVEEIKEENCINDEVSSNLDETVLNLRNKNANDKFIEMKSLYITGSCDDLDATQPVLYKRQVSINISGSCDELKNIDEKPQKLNKYELNES